LLIDLPKNGESIVSNVILSAQKPKNLNEVIVSAKRPAIVVKKDTIVFDVNSFKQGDERVVEDLLRKIPGLTIDDNGNIKVGNQEVERVMVEGDDFFEKGYKILTKNMPVKPLDKVEIIQNYSNNKLLKGIEKSNKVALNLKLREDTKRVWFGTAEAALSPQTEAFFDVRANFMNFGKKNKFYFFTNLNNSGYDATGNLDNLIRPDDQAIIGDGESVQPIMVKDFNSLDFKKERVNFNNSKLASLNSILNPTSKLKIKIVGLFDWDKNSFFRNSTEQYILPGTNFTNTEIDLLNKNKFTGYGKFDLSYDLSKTSTLDLLTRYNNSTDRDNSDLTFNNIPLPENLETKNSKYDQTLLYTDKLSPENVVVLTGRVIAEQSPQQYQSNSFNFKNLFTADTNGNNIAQTIRNNMDFYGIEGHWFNKRDSTNLFELSAGNKLRVDRLNSDFLIKDDGKVIDQPGNYQNQGQYRVNTTYINSKFTFSLSPVTLATKIDLSSFSTKYTSFGSATRNDNLYVDPRLSPLRKAKIAKYRSKNGYTCCWTT
jgi:hypothetical protein